MLIFIGRYDLSDQLVQSLFCLFEILLGLLFGGTEHIEHLGSHTPEVALLTGLVCLKLWRSEGSIASYLGGVFGKDILRFSKIYDLDLEMSV